MSAVEYLRQFVSQRLTAAAEEIFGVFEKTVIEYEEEIDRQRKLLDIVWKPDIKLHRIELQQQHVCQEEEVLADQQLCIEERNSSLDQEDPDPPQIKEEQQELYISQEGEQPALKQETDTLLLTPTDEESDHSEDQTVSFSIKRHHNNTSHSINVNNPELSEFRHKTHTGKKSVRCDRCGKYFRCNAILKEHMTTHTGEKPYLCKTCGKRFSRLSSLTRHTRTHIGMDPCICKTCGKDFLTGNILAFHMRTAHTGAGAKSKKNLAVRGREVRNLACNWRVAGSNPGTDRSKTDVPLSKAHNPPAQLPGRSNVLPTAPCMSSHSNMSVRRRRLLLTSSSVLRRGTPVWTRRTQILHRSKRNSRNSVPVRRESSLH
ncbi:zinc finger and SCAN domain-containing protein 31-like isoform X2 [Centropristis striata]|uniref:zinc finger and SCAN domain-containing protein 31-like isoform X2 n=1 Tax=Centropristis striata TaxID=184440 RepID=UPI0027DFC1AC|nr:zinc finger and SCAN domain-containing protein 31-like isoform X2 [Centropristis striata]